MKNIFIMLIGLGLLAVPVFALETEGNNTTKGGKVDVSQYENVTNFTALFQSSCTSEEGAEAGALPGDFTYGFKRFFENVDKFFTLDKSESAKKHAKYGKLRAVEAHLMTCKAKAQSDAGMEAESDQTIDTVEELVDDQNGEITDAQTDIEAAVEDGSANETDVEEVDNVTRNSIIVLQRVYEKAPESAKDGLLRALNNSIANYEKHTQKMEEKGEKGDDENEENETNTTSSGKSGEHEDENETDTEDHGKPSSVGSNVTTGKGGSEDNETSSGGPGNSGGKGGSHSEDNETED